MAKGVALELDLGKKLSLLLAGAMALGMPVVFGQVNAAPLSICLGSRLLR